MGDSRIAVVHGDAHSLSGWSFAIESMEPVDNAIIQSLGCTPSVTKTSTVNEWLLEAQVDGFACTHTCLPFAQTFDSRSDGSNNDSSGDNNGGVVVNNGSAGMPNFKDMSGVSLITRIATIKDEDVRIPKGSLYGTTIGNLRIDAIGVEYDHNKWMSRFLLNWPVGSPAHESYFNRIDNGTDLDIRQAARKGFTLTDTHRK